jgi:hypothetical protein
VYKNTFKGRKPIDSIVDIAVIVTESARSALNILQATMHGPWVHHDMVGQEEKMYHK